MNVLSGPPLQDARQGLQFPLEPTPSGGMHLEHSENTMHSLIVHLLPQQMIVFLSGAQAAMG